MLGEASGVCALASALLLTSCVTLANVSTLSGPQFAHLPKEGDGPDAFEDPLLL